MGSARWSIGEVLFKWVGRKLKEGQKLYLVIEPATERHKNSLQCVRWLWRRINTLLIKINDAFCWWPCFGPNWITSMDLVKPTRRSMIGGGWTPPERNSKTPSFGWLIRWFGSLAYYLCEVPHRRRAQSNAHLLFIKLNYVIRFGGLNPWNIPPGVFTVVDPTGHIALSSD